MRNHLLFTLVIGLAACASARGQETRLEDKVRAAVEGYRAGNHELLFKLKASPERIKTLPYLEPYVADKDDRVRGAVLTLVRGIHTPEAIRILTTMFESEQPDLPYGIAGVFYDQYSCEEIAQPVRERFRDQMLRLAKAGGVLLSAKSILLLSCFNGDETVRRFIESVRGGNRTVMLGFGMPPVSIRIPLDMALAYWGRADGVEKVNRMIDSGKVDDLFFVLSAMKFINDESLLKRLAALMQDKRDVVKACSEYQQYIRMADLAVYAFAERLAPDVVGVKPQEVYPYRDEEIASAYERVKTWFKSKEGRKR